MTWGKGHRPELDVQLTMEPAGPVAAGSPVPAQVRATAGEPVTVEMSSDGRAVPGDPLAPCVEFIDSYRVQKIGLPVHPDKRF